MGQKSDHSRRDRAIQWALGLLLTALVIIDFHLLWHIWREGSL